MPLSFSSTFAALDLRDARFGEPANSQSGPATSRNDVAEGRRAEPRAVTNSALAALRALGPRLTPAQRTSIEIFEGYDDKRQRANPNRNLFANGAPEEIDLDGRTPPARRARFLLVKPAPEEN
jgi:hypothetical protein